MPIKFQVKMEEKYMVDFMFRHNYAGFSGIMTVVAGVLCGMVSIQGFANGNLSSGAVWAMCAILFLVVNPNTIKSKAKAQVKNSEGFKKPFEYEFTDEGIFVRQEEAESFVKKAVWALAIAKMPVVLMPFRWLTAWPRLTAIFVVVVALAPMSAPSR